MRRPGVSAVLPRSTAGAGAVVGAVMVLLRWMLRCVMDRPNHDVGEEVNYFIRAVSLTPDTQGEPGLRRLCPDSFQGSDCARLSATLVAGGRPCSNAATSGGTVRQIHCAVEKHPSNLTRLIPP